MDSPSSRGPASEPGRSRRQRTSSSPPLPGSGRGSWCPSRTDRDRCLSPTTEKVNLNCTFHPVQYATRLLIAAHRRSFPLHHSGRGSLEVQRGIGGRELGVLEERLVVDAVVLQLGVVLVLVRGSGGEHGPDAEASQLQRDDRRRRSSDFK